MPGVIGMVRLDGEPVTITTALQKLQHFSTYQSQEVYRAQGVTLGIVYCRDHAPAFDWHFDPGARIGVLIGGTMLAAAPMPHVVRASEVLRGYLLKLLGFNRLEQTPLGQLRDRPRFEQLRDDFFNANVRPQSRRSSWLTQWKRPETYLLARSTSTARAVHGIRGISNNSPIPAAGALNTLRRIALLSLLQDHLSDFNHP